jgi:hypothetical protein
MRLVEADAGTAVLNLFIEVATEPAGRGVD